jgi:dihydroorotate dehydrogenase electron transfer subunit
MIKDKRRTLPIAGIIEETENVRTFTFDVQIPALPGQFIMLTDFNGGEKPFSISDHEDGFLSVTIKRIGEFTSRLFKMKKGDTLSFRGAYGSSFLIPGKDSESDISPVDFKPVLCGGGFGLPPLYLLAKHLLAAGVPAENLEVISAGRTEDDLLFEERFHNLGLSYTGAAETLNSEPVVEGCGRLCGTAADALSGIVVGDSFDEPACNFVYASGPDLMMASLIPHIPQIAEYQFLFERYMKCAIGICGSCAVDPSGIRICREGPALMRTRVEQLEDFGVYRRTASGSIDYFKNRLGAGIIEAGGNV